MATDISVSTICLFVLLFVGALVFILRAVTASGQLYVLRRELPMIEERMRDYLQYEDREDMLKAYAHLADLCATFGWKAEKLEVEHAPDLEAEEKRKSRRAKWSE